MEVNVTQLDYAELWLKLRARFEREAAFEAVRCAQAKEDVIVRRAQGAHEMAKRAVAIMDEIKNSEINGGVAFDEDGNSIKH